MDKIVCLDKDYQIHKVYDNLDLLLEEIKGSKTQAQKALEDPTLSFRGFKLVEQEKLPSVYANLYHEKVESLRNEYGETIEDLEQKLKESSKTERKAKFRVDELEDDYSTKYKAIKESHEKEQNNLKAKYNNEKEELDNSFKQFIEDLKSQHTLSVNDLKKQASVSEESVIAAYTEHTNELNKTISEYISEQEKKKVEHETAVTELNKSYTTKIENILANVNTLNAYLENNRNSLLNKVSSLMEVMVKMVNGDKKVYLLDEDKLPELSETITTKTLIDPKEYVFKEDKTIINIEDYLPKEPKKIEKAKSDNLPKEPKVLNEKSIVEKELPTYTIAETPVKVYTETEVKVVDKVVETKTVEKETPKEIKKVEPTYVKGILLKEKDAYTELTDGAKGLYLANLMIKGLTVKDLENHLGNVVSDIKGEVADVVVSELVSQNKTYSIYLDFLNGLNLVDVTNRLNLSKEEKDLFLEKEPVEFKDVTPKNPAEFETEKKTVSENGLPAGAINFNWGKYIDRITQNVDMEELLDKETVTLRDLQEVISVPSKQILGMLGVLKNLGYKKDFSNERVVSNIETTLLIVVASSHSSQQGKESLEDLINKLYPSWVQYRKRNNI